MRMNIGILGSGNVGGTLGKRWEAAGHQVTFATRDRTSWEVYGHWSEDPAQLRTDVFYLLSQ